MLLLAGFVISATAIIAIGAYTALQTGDTQVTTQTNRPLLDLFLNSRERAVEFFDLVSEYDTAGSVEDNLDGYLFSQHQTARSLSVQLNASLAGEDNLAPKSEEVHFTDGSNQYEWLTGEKLWSKDGRECYSGLTFDGTNDGLITKSDGTVVGAIFWLEVEGVDIELEEYIVIDVPSTSVSASC